MMGTLEEMIVRLLESSKKRLEFKEAALRYCNHSQKRRKLSRQVIELRKLVELYDKYAEEDDE